MSLTKDQQTIYDKVIKDIKEVQKGDIFSEHSFISITGAAGTGKTFLSKYIIEYILSKNMTCTVLAPTHQAVNVIKNNTQISHKNLKFNTLHSFLSLKPGKIDLKTGERKFVQDHSKRKSQENVDIIIIDESSMIGKELYDFLKGEMFVSNRIKAILFLGDKFQLPSIENDKIEQSEPKSVIYDNNLINHYELTELIRNDDMEVVLFLTEIRKMIERNASKTDLMNFLVNERNKHHNKIKFYNKKDKFIEDYKSNNGLGKNRECIVAFTNNKVDDYNKNIRNFYVQEKYNFNKFIDLVEEDLLVVQNTNDAFLNSELISLKSMIKKTVDFKGKNFRGIFCTDSEGRTFNYLLEESREEFERACEAFRIYAIKAKNNLVWKDYYKLKSLFLETKFHYSMTIHKSQGSSYENIWVDITNVQYLSSQMLLRLFYVGASRSKNNVNILL